MLQFVCLVALAGTKTSAQGTAASLDVFAAVSLRESFQAIARDFERTHSGIQIHLSFGGSQQLAAQINQGAPCDVFASADERNLSKISYVLSTRRVIALNRLVEVVPPRLRGQTSFRDLAGLSTIVLAAPVVPAGGYAQQALLSASMTYGSSWLGRLKSHVVSQEQDVRAVLAKVELGEADAGIVYATDAAIAGSKVKVVQIPREFQPRISYPVAIVSASAKQNLGREFLHVLLSPTGQAQLVARGFVSSLAPRGYVLLKFGSSEQRFRLPLHGTMSTVKALGTDKKIHSYTGVPLMALLGRRMTSANSQVIFTAADEYQRSYALGELQTSKAILIPKKGFVQLVIPGHPAFDWIDRIAMIVAP